VAPVVVPKSDLTSVLEERLCTGLIECSRTESRNGTARTLVPSSVALQDERGLTTLSLLQRGIEQSVTLDCPIEDEISIIKACFAWLDLFQVYGFVFQASEIPSYIASITKTMEVAAHFCRSYILNNIDDYTHIPLYSQLKDSICEHGRLDLCARVQCGLFRAFPSTGAWVDYFKYKNAAFFAAAFGDQTLPQRPPQLDTFFTVDQSFPVTVDGIQYFDWQLSKPIHHEQVLFGGKFYSFMCVLKRSGEYESFATSVLMSKKGMPRPPDCVVKRSIQKNYRVMTSEQDQQLGSFQYKKHQCFNWDEFDAESQFDRFLREVICDDSINDTQDFTVTREIMEGQLRRTTREVFRNFDLPLNALSSYMLPSPSANVHCSRTELGTYGFLDSLPHTDELRQELLKNFPTFHQKMVKLKGYVSEYYGSDKRSSFEDFNSDLDHLIEDSREVYGVEFDDTAFLLLWRRFYWRCVSLALAERPEVTVVGLQEALKVRCISKGPPLLYFVLKPLQRAMWSQLQKFWNFELTGKSVTTELVNKRFGGYFRGHERYHSGDYSAATDNLHSWVSECVGDSIVDRWEENSGIKYDVFRDLLRRSLTGHIYLTPDGPFAQQRGQLMGSITSFPVLCLINASVMRFTYELAHSCHVTLKHCPVWINGDDCLTRYTNPLFPTIWRSVCKTVGFEESVGKTYDSRNFFSINSHTYRVGLDGVISEIPYINLGLVEGMKRSIETAAKTNGDTVYELGARHCTFLDKAGRHSSRANQLFLYRHFETLKTYKGPWFLPQWCCGLGLRSEDPYSEDDRRTVSALKSLYSEGNLPPRLSGKKEWVHYDAVERQMRKLSAEYPIDRYNYETTEGSEGSFNFFSLLHWLAKGLSSIHNTTEAVYQREYAEELWSIARKEKHLFQPSDGIENEPKQSCWPVTLVSNSC
jgi:hypothetical protein